MGQHYCKSIYLIFFIRLVLCYGDSNIRKNQMWLAIARHTKTQVKVIKESHWYDSNKSWQKLFIQTSSVFKISQLITLLTEKNFEFVAPMIIQLSHHKSKNIVEGGGISSFSSMMLLSLFCFLFRQHSFDLTETKLIGVLCSSDLWEGSESESALHLTYVVVQNCGRTESLS